ncbi:hypothetical protein D3C72_2006510 [compost metagenome]
MHIIEVNHIGIEVFQRALDRLSDIIWPTIDTPGHLVVIINLKAELAGEDILVAFAAYGPGDQPFVFKGPIQIGRIQKVATQFQRSVDGSYGFFFVGLAVDIASGRKTAHPHAA